MRGLGEGRCIFDLRWFLQSPFRLPFYLSLAGLFLVAEAQRSPEDTENNSGSPLDIYSRLPLGADTPDHTRYFTHSAQYLTRTSPPRKPWRCVLLGTSTGFRIRRRVLSPLSLVVPVSTPADAVSASCLSLCSSLPFPRLLPGFYRGSGAAHQTTPPRPSVTQCLKVNVNIIFGL